MLYKKIKRYRQGFRSTACMPRGKVHTKSTGLKYEALSSKGKSSNDTQRAGRHTQLSMEQLGSMAFVQEFQALSSMLRDPDEVSIPGYRYSSIRPLYLQHEDTELFPRSCGAADMIGMPQRTIGRDPKGRCLPARCQSRGHWPVRAAGCQGPGSQT